MPRAPRVAPGKLIAGDREIHLGKLEERILWCLAARHPAGTTKDDLIRVVYGDREDGGPLWAEENIRTMIYRLRKKLKGTGWGIYSQWFVGYMFRRSP